MRTVDWLGPLAPHAARLTDINLRQLIESDPWRIKNYTVRVGPIQACFARQRVDDKAALALFQTAQMRGVDEAFKALFDGACVNGSESRPALHTALRSAFSESAQAHAARCQSEAVHRQMTSLIEDLKASEVTDLINIGIGGSDLGPRLALEALRDLDPNRFRVHFLSTADGTAAAHVLRGLDPSKTAAILVSKSFGTQETLLNGQVVRDWMGNTHRMYAVTANTERAEAFGINATHILPMWDWVGGRYSVWSAVGFVVAAALGMDVFYRFLSGAALMDEHVCTVPVEENLAIRHGLIAVWNRDALGYATHAILPYDDRLARLPAYLQQLVMESLGKSATQTGESVGFGTSPVIWGGAGTDVQHSFFQALHQGTDTIPMDFIGVIRAVSSYPGHRQALLSNLLAQAEVFANGAPSEDLQKAYPGNRPSTMLLIDELTPEALGALLAMYEHSVFVQATIWGINPFDQWGVELGKTIASGLMAALASDDVPVSDPVTRALIERIRAGSVISD